MSTDAIEIYEALRATTLNGNGTRSGLAMIIYHGMLHGLQLFAADAQCTTKPQPLVQHSVSPLPPMDDTLVRVLANMVLQSQPEVLHVY